MSISSEPSDFATTQWSVVLRAAHPDSLEARSALELLCPRYWFPLYAYTRRRVPQIHEAQDLTQEFFLRLLSKNALAVASPERGRFRSFLLTSLKNFLANEWDRTAALKRGGRCDTFSLDWDSGESRFAVEPTHDITPEKQFERQWALTLLDIVIHRLQAEFQSANKSQQFELLKDALSGNRTAIDYAVVASMLQLSEEATRQAAHRLRKRYRELLREEVAQTVDSPEDVNDEIHRLFETLGP